MDEIIRVNKRYFSMEGTKLVAILSNLFMEFKVGSVVKLQPVSIGIDSLAAILSYRNLLNYGKGWSMHSTHLLFNEKTHGLGAANSSDCLSKYGKIYQATTHKIKCLLCLTATEPTHTYQIRYILYV